MALQACVLKTWSPARKCREAELWGSDWGVGAGLHQGINPLRAHGVWPYWEVVDALRGGILEEAAY